MVVVGGEAKILRTGRKEEKEVVAWCRYGLAIYAGWWSLSYSQVREFGGEPLASTVSIRYTYMYPGTGYSLSNPSVSQGIILSCIALHCLHLFIMVIMDI